MLLLAHLSHVALLVLFVGPHRHQLSSSLEGVGVQRESSWINSLNQSAFVLWSAVILHLLTRIF